MRISELRKGIANSSGRYVEVGYVEEETAFWVSAIESDELSLLVKTEVPLHILAGELELTDETVGIVSIDCNESAIEKEDLPCNLIELLGICMENGYERHEIWEHDGGEGIAEAAESEYALAFLIAYDFMLKAWYPYRYLNLDIEQVEPGGTDALVFSDVLHRYADIDAIDLQELMESFY